MNKIIVSCKMEVLRKGIIYFFPFRDSLGLFLGSIPLRIGEVFSCLYIVPLIKEWKNFNTIEKKEKILLSILLLNLFITILGVIFHFDSITVSFAIKYIIRNILNIILISGFIYSSFIYTKNDIEKLMKFTVLLQFSLFILLYFLQHYIFMSNIFDISSYKDNGVHFGTFWLPRFIGTCTEPGYLAPLLPMCLYYYLKQTLILDHKNKIIFLILCLIMIIATFSAAVYVMALLVILYVFAINFREKRVRKAIVGVSICLLIALCFFSSNQVLSNYIINGIYNKILAYITLSTDYMMSSNDRVQQILNCIDFILKGDFISVIFGNGTGSYAYYVSNEVSLLSTAQEAHNLYLSTIADRGIFGIVLIFMLFSAIKSFLINDDLNSQTIFVGIFLQFLHWIIVGNFWVYYFWYEVIILIGYYKNCSKLNK